MQIERSSRDYFSSKLHTSTRKLEIIQLLVYPREFLSVKLLFSLRHVLRISLAFKRRERDAIWRSAYAFRHISHNETHDNLA